MDTQHGHRPGVGQRVEATEQIDQITILLSPGAKPFCKVNILWVNDKCSGQGLGTLLMSYAILEAKRNNCERVSLYSSLQGIPLYASLGFVPNISWVVSDPHWGDLSVLQKAKIIEELDCSDLYLDLDEANFRNILPMIFSSLASAPQTPNSLDARSGG